ncbi:MAG: hypothetical protein EHM45_01455 [Desulfobacteraceae bacterium]|nr:MAG: hypothetical protein EHM45_01455 [Desulfobacteraceae bacterium]
MLIMNNLFTDSMKKAIEIAQEEAVKLHNDFVGTEHLLLGVFKTDDGAARTWIWNMGIDPEALAGNIEKGLAAAGGIGITRNSELPLTPQTKRVLDSAAKEAQALNHESVGFEHLFLALLADADSAASLMLADFGLDYEKVKKSINQSHL